MSGSGKYVHVHVRLACGHEYDESRPPNVIWPTDGEQRVCGVSGHYPQTFAAAYSSFRIFDEWHPLEHVS